VGKIIIDNIISEEVNEILNNEEWVVIKFDGQSLRFENHTVKLTILFFDCNVSLEKEVCDENGNDNS